MVMQTFQNQKVDLNALECRDVAALILETRAVDPMEIFSPKRFTAKAGALGLRPGLSTDLEEGWDLDKEEGVVAMMDHMELDKPVLTGSPPCEAFSQLRHIWAGKEGP